MNQVLEKLRYEVAHVLKCICRAAHVIGWNHKTENSSLWLTFSRRLKSGVYSRATTFFYIYSIFPILEPWSLSESGAYLYVDDTFIFYQDKDIYQVENVLTKEFSTLCEWFVSNKLPYYLEKIKCVLFSKTENLSKSNIT